MVLLERKSVRPTTNLRQRVFDPALLKDAASARAECLKEWRKAEAAGCWLLIRLWALPAYPFWRSCLLFGRLSRSLGHQEKTRGSGRSNILSAASLIRIGPLAEANTKAPAAALATSSCAPGA